MQLRPAFSSLVWSLLYWALFALATAFAAPEDSGDKIPVAEPHIAVILPLQSNSFGKYADSVRLGIMNAAGNGQAGSLKVKVYATSEDPQQILAAYQRATSLGARAVIGPLTRNGVTSLAQSGLVNVPTLALNLPDGELSLPRDFYVYGLQIEAEARQGCPVRVDPRHKQAFIIAGDTALGMRIAQTFSEEWKKLGAEVTGQFSYTTDSATLARLREQVMNSRADIVFMSLDAARARFIRSYLGASVPIYATSLVFTSNADALANFDLDGVRFLDMPLAAAAGSSRGHQLHAPGCAAVGAGPGALLCAGNRRLSPRPGIAAPLRKNGVAGRRNRHDHAECRASVRPHAGSRAVRPGQREIAGRLAE